MRLGTYNLHMCAISLGLDEILRTNRPPLIRFQFLLFFFLAIYTMTQSQSGGTIPNRWCWKILKDFGRDSRRGNLTVFLTVRNWFDRIQCPFLANIITSPDKRICPSHNNRPKPSRYCYMLYVRLFRLISSVAGRGRLLSAFFCFPVAITFCVLCNCARLVVSRQHIDNTAPLGRCACIHQYYSGRVMRKMFKRETAVDHVIYYATLRWNHLNARAATIYHIIFEPTSTPALCVCVRLKRVGYR